MLARCPVLGHIQDWTRWNSKRSAAEITANCRYPVWAEVPEGNGGRPAADGRIGGPEHPIGTYQYQWEAPRTAYGDHDVA